MHSRLDMVLRQPTARQPGLGLGPFTPICRSSRQSRARQVKSKSSPSQGQVKAKSSLDWTGLDSGLEECMQSPLRGHFREATPNDAHQLGQGRRGLATWCARELVLLWQPLTYHSPTANNPGMHLRTRGGSALTPSDGGATASPSATPPAAAAATAAAAALAASANALALVAARSTSSRVQSSRVKSSQVESSLLGASTRAGGQRRRWGWATAWQRQSSFLHT